MFHQDFQTQTSELIKRDFNQLRGVWTPDETLRTWERGCKPLDLFIIVFLLKFSYKRFVDIFKHNFQGKENRKRRRILAFNRCASLVYINYSRDIIIL